MTLSPKGGNTFHPNWDYPYPIGVLDDVLPNRCQGGPFAVIDCLGGAPLVHLALADLAGEAVAGDAAERLPAHVAVRGASVGSGIPWNKKKLQSVPKYFAVDTGSEAKASRSWIFKLKTWPTLVLTLKISYITLSAYLKGKLIWAKYDCDPRVEIDFQRSWCFLYGFISSSFSSWTDMNRVWWECELRLSFTTRINGEVRDD